MENWELGEEQTIKKENVLFGLVGALLGTVPGIILWVIVGQLGFVASACGMIIALGATLGCCMLGKCSGIKVLVISVLAILLATFAAICLNYIIAIMKYVHSPIDQSIELFKLMLAKSSEYRLEFFKSIGIGYLMSFLGAYATCAKFIPSKNKQVSE